MPKVQGAFIAACGSGFEDCAGLQRDSTGALVGGFNINNFLTMPGLNQRISAAMMNQSVYINAKGDIKTSMTSDHTVSKTGSFGSEEKTGLQTINNSEEGTEGFERIFCMSMPNAATKFIQPIRGDMGVLYDMLFTGKCTGDWSVFNALKDGDQTFWESIGNTWKQSIGSGTGIILLAGGLVSGAIVSTNSTRKTDVSKSFIDTDGQCKVNVTVTTTSQSSYVLGLVQGKKETNVNSRTELVPELKGARRGKGLELFDSIVLSSLQLD